MPLPEPVQALADLTTDQVQTMPAGARKRLSEECRRIYRIIEGDKIMREAREATAPKDGVLALLRAGERAP